MIYIHIRALQPLCMSAEQAQGTIRRTIDYIPGSALRGALAAQLRRTKPHINQESFDQLMLAEGVQFRNLYPLPSGIDIVRPLPKTARSCKLYPGFSSSRQRPGHKPDHGVRDLLFPLLRYSLTGGKQPGDILLDQRCGFDDHCNLPLEPFSGVYGGFQAGNYRTVTPRQRQVTQTAIDPNRETASPSNLFTVEVLEENTEFAGFFSLGDASAEADFCETVCTIGDHLRIGYGRTRGLGLVEVLNCRVEAPYFWSDDLLMRLEAFNETAQNQKCNIPNGYSLFALTLLSDAIILDPFFRHQAGLDGPTIAREIHHALGDSRLVAAFADTRQVFGWSSPHRLPVPADLAVTAGSVFVFLSPKPVEELAEIFETTDVERVGIGERRAEGFGQVVVCHPFHQEVSPV